MQLLRNLILLVCLAGLGGQVAGQCVPDSLVPNVPGIYPDTLPEATGCQYYDEVVTFVFPRDTTVTVAGNTLTFPFVAFTIDSIIGLPAGLDWACNLADCRYVVHPDSAAVDTIGCIRIFGTPNIPATYPLVVAFTAQLAAFGTVQDNPATYEAPLTVTPCVFTGACYTLSLSSNCEPALLSLANNVPSGGRPGFDYQWQLSGPGVQYTTSDEQPAPQALVQAGTYTVGYEATIDTIGYILDGIRIDAVNCSDLLNAADLYWILLDPAGNQLVNTTANPISNGGDSLPYATGIGGILLDTGTYEFQVWDQDALVADEGCATGATGSGASVFFTTPPATAGDISITSGGLTVTLSISHPVQVISCTDTLIIDSLPAVPFITALGDSLPADTLALCAGDTLRLTTPALDSLQWYAGGVFLPDARDAVLAVTQAGLYAVEAIDRQTLCRTLSAPVRVEAQVIAAPSIAYDGAGTLQVAAPQPALRYDWYEAGTGLVGSGSPFQPESSGQYFCVAVDTLTGCASPPSVTLAVVLTGLPLAPADQVDLRLYPNPARGRGQVTVALATPGQALSLHLIDPLGRVCWERHYAQAPAEVQAEVDLRGLAPGLYLLRLSLPDGQRSLRWVVEGP